MFDMGSLKEAAIKLRQQGYSYTEIAKRTGLSKSTLSYHLSKMPYSPNQETVARVGRARVRAYETKYRNKLATYDAAAYEAGSDIGELTPRDILLLGIGIYAGEGSKTNDIVRLVNSDPAILRLFIRWLRQMGLDSSNLAVRVHLYPETNRSQAEQYWLRELSLPVTSLQKTYVDKRKDKKSRKQGAQKFGTAHVTVRSRGNKAFGVRLARRISAYLKLVLELPEEKRA